MLRNIQDTELRRRRADRRVENGFKTWNVIIDHIMAASATTLTESDISVGDTFETYAEVREKIDEYKKAACTDLYIWDSQTIANAAKHGVKIPIKTELKYYYIKFACYMAGKNRPFRH